MNIMKLASNILFFHFSILSYLQKHTGYVTDTETYGVFYMYPMSYKVFLTLCEQNNKHRN